MTLPILPPAPTRQDPTNFSNLADAWVDALGPWTTAANALEGSLQYTNITGTSTTSKAIAIGSWTLTTQLSKAWIVGGFIYMVVASDVSKYMLGQITAYDPLTGAMTVNVTTVQGSGTFNSWLLGLSIPLAAISNLAGGVAGSIPYQSAPNTTAFKTPAEIVAVATSVGGTGGNMTATFTPSLTSFVDGMEVSFRATNDNTGTSPTFDASGLGAKVIRNIGGATLLIGDIKAGSSLTVLKFDTTLDAWILQNPVKYNTERSKIQPITASVASSALTVTLSPTTLDFRSPTLNNGAVTTMTVPSLSITVPNTATLGTINAVSARLVVIAALINSTTVELCITNLAGGLQLDETNLISPTLISTGADSNNIIYSATSSGATNITYRVVGFVDIQQSTAGVWATAPTLVQGAGGQALASLSSLGYGQTWQDVTTTPGRSLGTTYYNTTGRPISVSVTVLAAGAALLTVNGITIYGSWANSAEYLTVNAIIPPGSYYGAGTTVGIPVPILSNWSELR